MSAQKPLAQAFEDFLSGAQREITEEERKAAWVTFNCGAAFVISVLQRCYDECDGVEGAEGASEVLALVESEVQEFVEIVDAADGGTH